MRLVVDENIASEIARFLQYVYGGQDVDWIHVTDLGSAYLKGRDEWMLRVCDTGDLIITRDRDQSTRYPDRMIAQAGGRMLILGPWFDHLPVKRRALWFVKHGEAILGYARSMRPGMVWRLERNGARTVVLNAGPRP